MSFAIAFFHVVIACTILANWWYLRRTRASGLAEGPLPGVSILVPARNEERHITRLLTSILGQQYPDFEVIIYDDVSEDRTRERIDAFSDPRIVVLSGGTLPDGWIGKVHALYQATRNARGEIYLFLDADVELTDTTALSQLVQSLRGLPAQSVITTQPRLGGRGIVLVSLLPHIVLGALPWPLVRRIRIPSLGMINGQCWMIEAAAYHQYEPHLKVRHEVLEDVKIAHYLKKQGLTPVLIDARSMLTVDMYDGFKDAWQGFRKNVYLLMGGSVGTFVMLFALFFFVYILPALVALELILSLYLIKALTDRYMGFPYWVTLLTPVTMVLASLLQLDSAWHHWRGGASWKGRQVSG